MYFHYFFFEYALKFEFEIQLINQKLNFNLKIFIKFSLLDDLEHYLFTKKSVNSNCFDDFLIYLLFS